MCHVQAVGDSQTGLLLGVLAQKPLSGWALCEISMNVEKRHGTCSQEGSDEGSAPAQITSRGMRAVTGEGCHFSVCLLGHSCCSGANTQCPLVGRPWARWAEAKWGAPRWSTRCAITPLPSWESLGEGPAFCRLLAAKIFSFICNCLLHCLCKGTCKVPSISFCWLHC